MVHVDRKRFGGAGLGAGQVRCASSSFVSVRGSEGAQLPYWPPFESLGYVMKTFFCVSM